MRHPDRSKPHWTCANCTVHFGDLKLREIVIEHLKSAYVSSHLSQSRPHSLIYAGMGSTHPKNQRIYSSSNKTGIPMLLRRATRLNLPESPATVNSVTEGSYHWLVNKCICFWYFHRDNVTSPASLWWCFAFLAHLHMDSSSCTIHLPDLFVHPSPVPIHVSEKQLGEIQ